MFFPILIFLVALNATSALQFVRVHTLIPASNFFPYQFGMDFTVTRTINISHFGLLDLGMPGLAGTGVAMIFDRATNQSVMRIEFFANGTRREDDSNLFAFKPTGALLLQRGIYCLVAQMNPNDAYASTVLHSSAISTGDDGDGAVLATAAVAYLFGSNLQTYSYNPTGVHSGASFLFSVVDVLPAPPRSPALFADCEAVACAGLPSGEYNIRNQIRHCDNEMKGGGWMRLWRLDDTTCEANGWSSARSTGTWAASTDPLGCRPAQLAGGCKQGLTALSPFRFSEVRGGNFAIWAAGGPNGFAATLGQSWDGVQITDGRGALLWTFVVGLATTYAETRCPCDPRFTNYSQTVTNIGAANTSWSCDAVQDQSFEWKQLFRDSLSCSGRAAATDGVWFQRSLSAPQGSLKVSICKDEFDSDEELKLSAGDLFVRPTIGFDKSRCVVTTTSSTTTTATSTTTTASTTTTTMTASESTGSVESLTSPRTSVVEMISNADSSWIVPTAIAIVLAILLCMSLLVLIVVCRRVGAQRAAGEQATTMHETSSIAQSTYGDVSDIRK